MKTLIEVVPKYLGKEKSLFNINNSSCYHYKVGLIKEGVLVASFQSRPGDFNTVFMWQDLRKAKIVFSKIENHERVTV